METVGTVLYWINNAVTITLFVLTYIIGWATPVVARNIRTRRTKSFWRRFVDADHSNVVVGMHRRLADVDPAGLMGAGCVKALLDLQAVFVEANLGRLPSIVSSEPSPEMAKANLILIGGPAINSVTSEVLKRSSGRFEFGDLGGLNVAIVDKTTSSRFPSHTDWNNPTLDAGIIRRVPNPFNSQYEVLIIAGVFGYGTEAGVQLCRSESFLRHPVVSSGKPFECVFTTEVIADNALPPVMVDLVELPSRAS